MTITTHLRRVAILLVVLFVVYLPSVCFGQTEDGGVDLIMRAIAAWSENPGSPMALGAAVVFVVYLAVDAPYTSKLLGGLLSTPARKRAFAIVVSVAPGLALALSQHMTWNAAARTALLSFAVSQAIKFLSKSKDGAPAAILCLAFLSAGQAACVSKDKIEAGVNGGAMALDVAKPCLVDLQDREESACSGDAKCIDEVRTRWDVVATGYDAFGCLLCLVDDAADGCTTEKPCDRLAGAVR